MKFICLNLKMNQKSISRFIFIICWRKLRIDCTDNNTVDDTLNRSFQHSFRICSYANDSPVVKVSTALVSEHCKNQSEWVRMKSDCGISRCLYRLIRTLEGSLAIPFVQQFRQSSRRKEMKC
jgi:hypothetical protein